MKRDEKELLDAGNSNVKDLLDVKADDYRDKGMSEAEIAERLQQDKIEFQREFLTDAFPGQDISTDVFSSIEANEYQHMLLFKKRFNDVVPLRQISTVVTNEQLIDAIKNLLEENKNLLPKNFGYNNSAEKTY